MTEQDLEKAQTLRRRKHELKNLIGSLEWTDEQRIQKVFDEVISISATQGELLKNEISIFFNQLRIRAEAEIELIEKQFAEL